MLKLFALTVLILLAGCRGPEDRTDFPASAAGTLPVRTAREICSRAMLDVRTAENYQRLQREHREETLQFRLPGEIARCRNSHGQTAEVQRMLDLAQMYLQELAAADTPSARKMLRRETARLLFREFDELAVRLLAGEKLLCAIEDAHTPALEGKRQKTVLDYENARLEMRTLLGLPAGVPFLLIPDEQTEPLPPERSRLETAFLSRPELEGSPFPPEELAAAVRFFAGMKTIRNTEESAMRTTLLLFRAPRELYKRKLKDRANPADLKYLLAALGLHAELELAEREFRQAVRAEEKIMLTAGSDPRSRVEQAEAARTRQLAEVRLRAAMGYPRNICVKPQVQTEPPEKLLKMLEFIEKNCQNE